MSLLNHTDVIVPLDGSEHALRALDYGAALAQAAGLKLHLLHVPPLNPVEMMQVMGYPVSAVEEAQTTFEEFERAREDMGAKVFAAARQRLPAGLSPVEALQPGEPARAILAYAARAGDPILVLGRRGLSGVRELLTGSVSNRVMHHATCPVTIVN